MRRWLRAALGALGEALYPSRCPLCGGAFPCAAHPPPRADELERGPPGPHCGRCARALAPLFPDGTRCAFCRRRAPPFERLLALADWRPQDRAVLRSGETPRSVEGTAGGPVLADAVTDSSVPRDGERPAEAFDLRPWVLAWKHGGRAGLARPLGAWLGRRVRGAGLPEGLLVPVPLHPVRRFERGFDQAASLARVLAGELGWPLRRLLRRRRWTPPQGVLGSVSRSANVSGAFGARRGSAVDLRGLRVWVVDDVVTSGATVSACIEVLRGLGARRVGVLALARADQARRETAAVAPARAPP